MTNLETSNLETPNPQSSNPQTSNLQSRIANVIAPHLKTKFKNSVSMDIAQQIINEINRPL